MSEYGPLEHQDIDDGSDYTTRTIHPERTAEIGLALQLVQIGHLLVEIRDLLKEPK